MRPLLCVLAGLALLRAAGAFAGLLDQHVPDLWPQPGSPFSQPTDAPPMALVQAAHQALSRSQARENIPASKSIPNWQSQEGGGEEGKKETVEKTVEHLEAELKGLLGLLEELARNLPPGHFSPASDLLGGDDPF
ncbi:placenta-specific protein 9 [Orycteropus afer afer]|uniref:Placenta-specific protein 9 n=1 Tax=Orycteropus afer afer TaxID=1230840 RepID=A0A8B6ZSI8_ORYAF|nr:placenta-specific protein 9 [Orycteropus afer afer]